MRESSGCGDGHQTGCGDELPQMLQRTRRDHVRAQRSVRDVPLGTRPVLMRHVFLI